jgi:hypothetical protein
MMRRSKLLSFVRSAALLLTFVMLTSCETPKYASDYPLEKGQVKEHVHGDWTVSKQNSGTTEHLSVSRHKETDKDLMDCIVVEVFDTPEDAEKEYQLEYSIRKDGDQTYWEEGKNWFKGEPPVAFGYYTTSVFCLEDNVVIRAALSERLSENQPYVPMEPMDTSVDRSGLKDYVIDNASGIRETVLEDVLGY